MPERPSPNPYDAPARAAAQALAPLDGAREAALREARGMTRLASRLIRDLHRGAIDAADAHALDQARRRLEQAVASHPGLAVHGAVVQALGEFAEVHLLRAHLERTPVPTAPTLHVPPAAYLLGLGDLVGELRRVVLDRLGQGDDEEAQRAFEAIQKAYEALAGCDAPEGVAAIRSKVDAARALVERTRSDVVTSKRTKTLEKKVDGLSRLLDEAEGEPTPRRAPRRDPDDLDLDKAWAQD